jgi:hypothetical protein
MQGFWDEGKLFDEGRLLDEESFWLKGKELLKGNCYS